MLEIINLIKYNAKSCFTYSSKNTRQQVVILTTGCLAEMQRLSYKYACIQILFCIYSCNATASKSNHTDKFNAFKQLSQSSYTDCLIRTLCIALSCLSVIDRLMWKIITVYHWLFLGIVIIDKKCIYLGIFINLKVGFCCRTAYSCIYFHFSVHQICAKFAVCVVTGILSAVITFCGTEDFKLTLTIGIS